MKVEEKTVTFVVPLHAIGRGDLALAGGKGANLGELVRAGFPVPAGFVVTTDAYRLVAPDASGDADAAVTRAALEAAAVPDALREAITHAHGARSTSASGAAHATRSVSSTTPFSAAFAAVRAASTLA